MGSTDAGTFAAVFGAAPAVRACAPGRVNLLGEHTDYNDGFVLPTAIPQQTTVSLRANGSDTFVVHAATLRQQARFSLDTAPAEHFARYLFGCIRGVAGLGVAVPGLDIHVDSQVPMGVGLSSSAALEVAMLRALRELLDIRVDGLALDDVAIAQLAQRAEIEHAGVHCGIMDQMASSLADTRSMLFLDTRSFDRRLLPLPAQSQLLVIDSGISRALADTGYNQRRAQCEQAARLLGVGSLREFADASGAAAADPDGDPDRDHAAIGQLPEPLPRRVRHVLSENARVLRAAGGVDAQEFGRLMNASHASLRDDYEVSVPALDLLVSLLQAHPQVHGARLTGAGFGGACVALCHADAAGGVAAEVIERYRLAGHSGRMLVPASEEQS